ncbi:MAG TPA: DNA gyrase modulator, partial [Casimicrobiaceae bacterium]
MTLSLTVDSATAGRAPAIKAVDETAFPVTTSVLQGVADDVLRFARERGASAAETEVSQAVGQSVTVRKAEVETISYNRDKGISVTVY